MVDKGEFQAVGRSLDRHANHKRMPFEDGVPNFWKIDSTVERLRALAQKIARRRGMRWHKYILLNSLIILMATSPVELI